MYIKRKLYSTYTDGGGEERLFSTTEFVDEDQYLNEVIYSKNNRTRLEDIDSNRGRGRSAVIGLLAPGMIGGYMGKKEAEKADNEGLEDREIIKRAERKGGKSGAIAGAACSVPLALTSIYGADKLARFAKRNGVKVSRPAAIAGTLGKSAMLTAGAMGLGYLGGKLGARKNTRTRLEKRAYLDYNRNRDDRD